MSSLTRWVLAHKRTVVAFWLLLTVVGIGAAGPASDALSQEFSVPGKEGYETNVEIAKKYGNTGGDTAPFLPVVTLPAGKTVDSPACGPSCAQSMRASSARCQERGSPRTCPPVTARSCRPTAARPSRSPFPAATRTPPSARTRTRRSGHGPSCAASRWPARRCT